METGPVNSAREQRAFLYPVVSLLASQGGEFALKTTLSLGQKIPFLADGGDWTLTGWEAASLIFVVAHLTVKVFAHDRLC
jgi:hypothetical protein